MSVESIVREWVRRAWNEKDLSVVDELFADAATALGAPNSGSSAGKDEVRALFAAQHHAFPDMEARIVNLLVDGDRAAIHLEARGTHVEKLWGAPPTGERIFLEAFAVFIVRDGKIHGGQQILNHLALDKQLWGK